MIARRPSVRAAFAASLVSAAVACGGAAPSSPKSPQAPDATSREETEPQTVEEAEAEIARAKAELGQERAGDAAAEKTEVEPAPAGQPTDAPSAPFGRSDACGGSCRAIASMRRAVTALCRMTGDEDTRCRDAKRTLTESETRTAACGC